MIYFPLGFEVPQCVRREGFEWVLMRPQHIPVLPWTPQGVAKTTENCHDMAKGTLLVIEIRKNDIAIFIILLSTPPLPPTQTGFYTQNERSGSSNKIRVAASRLPLASHHSLNAWV